LGEKTSRSIKSCWLEILVSRQSGEFGRRQFLDVFKTRFKELQNRFTKFWQDIINVWADINDNNHTAPENALIQHLWYNPKIKVASKQVVRKNWCKKGVFFINDLMERDGGFMTLEGFNNKYNLNVNFIDFHGLINALPREWRQTILNSTPFEEVNNKYINLLKSIEKPTKYFYRILIKKIAEKPLKSQNKWKLFLGKEVSEEEWENVYSSTFYLLNDTQLQSFQFKINHRIIFANHLLMKCKLSETALCTL